MSKPLIYLSALSAALVAVTHPASARAESPAWCAAKGASESPTSGTLSTALTSTDPRDALYELVGVSCHLSGDAIHHVAEIEAARARWSKRLGLAEADWSDVVDWARQEPSTRGETELPANNDVAWSKLGPVAQYAAISFAPLNDVDPTYLADALGDKLTESGRLASIIGCLRAKEPAAWAMCAGDIAAFDPAKLAAEVRADTSAKGWMRMNVRLIAQDLPAKLAKHAVDVKAAVADDVAYGKMFELAAQARTAWAARATEDAALRDLALAMDDAHVTQSRHALDGCGERTMAAWRAAVGAIPAAKFAALRPIELRGNPSAVTAEALGPLADKALAVVIADPAGYLASQAVAMCDANALPLGALLAVWPGFRGPRAAVLTTLMQAGLELDRKGAQIVWPLRGRSRSNDLTPMQSGGGGRGTVLSVTAHGSDVRVEFAHKPATYEQCDEERRTNRITQITDDGRLIYESECVKTSRRKTDLRASTQVLSAAAAANLKPGMFADIEGGHVQVAWAKLDAKLPAIIFGVTVK